MNTLFAAKLPGTLFTGYVTHKNLEEIKCVEENIVCFNKKLRQFEVFKPINISQFGPYPNQYVLTGVLIETFEVCEKIEWRLIFGIFPFPKIVQYVMNVQTFSGLQRCQRTIKNEILCLAN